MTSRVRLDHGRGRSNVGSGPVSTGRTTTVTPAGLGVEFPGEGEPENSRDLVTPRPGGGLSGGRLKEVG